MLLILNVLTLRTVVKKALSLLFKNLINVLNE